MRELDIISIALYIRTFPLGLCALLTHLFTALTLAPLRLNSKMHFSHLALTLLLLLTTATSTSDNAGGSKCVDVNILEGLLETELQQDIDNAELAYALSFFPSILSHDDSDRVAGKYYEETGQSIDRYALYGSLREMGCVEVF